MTEKTADIYGFLWMLEEGAKSADRWHFNAMQEAIGEPIVRGGLGIEVGCGSGYDTYIMAKSNPSVRFISIDLSDGIYKTKERVTALTNVKLIKCSALDLPLKEKMFDFAYSFGVLHHTKDPKEGLREIARILKKDSPVFLYLYEDHSENPIKYIFIKMVTWARLVTVRLPSWLLYFLSVLISPVVFIIFTLPARLMMKFKPTKRIGENMPFNFGTGPFSLRGDIYDRFGAPIEHRFGRKTIFAMFSECGFYGVRITRLRNTAGWVAWGCKANA